MAAVRFRRRKLARRNAQELDPRSASRFRRRVRRSRPRLRGSRLKRARSRPPRCVPAGSGVPFDRLFTVDPSAANEDVMGTIPQALYLMNSPLVNSHIQARPGTVLGEIMSAAPNGRAALGRALPARAVAVSPQPRSRNLQPLHLGCRQPGRGV